MEDAQKPILANPQPDHAPEADHPAKVRRSATPPPRYVPFDPWRCTREGTAARRISDIVLSEIEAIGPERRRRRKDRDARTFAALVDALVANLLRLHLELPPVIAIGHAAADAHWINLRSHRAG